MPQETAHFQCPLCGMHAPLERLTEEQPFPLRLFLKKLGGKVALSALERAERRSWRSKPGGAPGKLDYVELPVTQDLVDMVTKRIDGITI